MPVFIQTSGQPENKGGIAYKCGGCTQVLDYPDVLDGSVIIIGPSGRNDPCQFDCAYVEPSGA